MESRIREAILAAVEQNGGRIGNQNLIQQVIQAGEAGDHTFSEQAIQAVREQLIFEGVLARGRGRGGSVYRIDAAEPAGQADQTGAAAPSTVSGTDRYGTYQHDNPATLRPEVGVQDQFAISKKPK